MRLPSILRCVRNCRPLPRSCRSALLGRRSLATIGSARKGRPTLLTSYRVEELEERLLLSTFTVNSLDDTDDGVCDAANCSLREAINAANGTGGAGALPIDIPASERTTIPPQPPPPPPARPRPHDAAPQPP